MTQRENEGVWGKVSMILELKMALDRKLSRCKGVGVGVREDVEWGTHSREPTAHASRGRPFPMGLPCLTDKHKTGSYC